MATRKESKLMGYTAEQALFFDGGIKVGHHINLNETNENLDDWVSLSDFDLNIWQSGDKLCLTVYSARNGNTDTSKHLFSIQLEKQATTPEAYRETAQSYFKLPYDQRGDANGN